MNKTTLIAVGVFALLLVVTLATREKKVSVGIKKMEVAAVNKDGVTAVDVTGVKTASLVKQGESWLVFDPAKPDEKFPTDEATVKGLMDAVGEFKAEEFVTDKTDKHEELEVNDAKGLRVKVKTGDKLAMDVVVGKFAKNGGAYVRKGTENDVYVTKSRLPSQAKKDVSGWRKRNIVNAKADEITNLNVKLNGGETYSLERDATNNEWKLKDGTVTPAGFRFDAQAAGRMAQTIASLRAQEYLDKPDAVPADIVGFGAEDVLEAKTKDGRTVVVHLGRQGDNEEQGTASTLRNNLEAMVKALGEKESKLTMDGLKKVINDTTLSEDVRKAARKVTENVALFDRLDLGVYGGGTKDGALTSSDLDAAAKTAALVPTKLDGDQQVYLLPGYSATQLRKKLVDLRDLSLVKLDPEKAKKVTVVAGDKKVVVSKKDGAWALEEPKQAPAGLEFDPAQVQTQLNMLKGLRAVRLVEPALADAQTGLNKPATSLEVEMEDGSKAFVRFGKEITNDKGAKEAYARGSADNALYVTTEYMKKRYENPIELYRKPAPPPNMGGMGGMGGMNGLDKLPPDVRRQLEAQLRNQGGMPR